MAKYVDADVLDFGLDRIRTASAQMLLLKTYVDGDDYATVLGNAICTVAVADADFDIGPGADGARVLTVSAKSGNASADSGAGPNLHIAFTDGTSKVLWVTDETTDQVITNGNPVNFPALTYVSGQPE